MYMKIGSTFADADLCFLEEILIVFDSILLKIDCDIQDAINNSISPDDLGLLDRGEYIVGMGFSACQRYMSSTFGPIKIEKPSALEIGPIHENGQAIAKIIHETANYWKHSDEWLFITLTKEPDPKMRKINIFDTSILSKQQKQTIDTVETVTPWADYTCANVLSSITKTSELKLLKLIPILTAWRNQLDKYTLDHGDC